MLLHIRLAAGLNVVSEVGCKDSGTTTDSIVWHIYLWFTPARDDGADATVLPQAAAATILVQLLLLLGLLLLLLLLLLLRLLYLWWGGGGAWGLACSICVIAIVNRLILWLIAAECAIFRGNWNRSGNDVVSSLMLSRETLMTRKLAVTMAIAPLIRTLSRQCTKYPLPRQVVRMRTYLMEKKDSVVWRTQWIVSVLIPSISDVMKVSC